ncbi:MAG: NADH-quinone oxidoreductase subunit NuoK [Acidobacteriota bacterium]|nr:NADH-quinone oxidoreductase subunit NuoK [Acidobacteriota bacterium]
MTGPGLEAYLIAGALLFGIGVAVVLSQRNAIMVLMGVEIITNAVILTLLAFWRFVRPDNYDAHVFAIVIVTIGAIEMAAGLALLLHLFRQRGNTNIDSLQELRR